MELYKVPSILIIHLKRFYKKKSLKHFDKIEDFVDFPINGFELKNYLKSSADSNSSYIYDLFAVTNHYGDLSGGHYTAICYNGVFDEWLNFNDSRVSEVDSKNIVSSSAYILYYRKID